MTLQTEGCGFESGSVRKYFFFLFEILEFDAYSSPILDT